MKSSPKLFLSLFPGFIVGMFFQHQISSNHSEASPSAAKMSMISKEAVNAAANRFINAGSLGKYQKVYGASFDKTELEQIVSGANGAVYVRVGFDNNVMSLYIGNESGEYIAPSADGYCPNNCPYNN